MHVPPPWKQHTFVHRAMVGLLSSLEGPTGMVFPFSGQRMSSVFLWKPLHPFLFGKGFQKADGFTSAGWRLGDPWWRNAWS
jgi:hypothetical protein